MVTTTDIITSEAAKPTRPSLRSLIVTGGVACGKSSVVEIWQNALPETRVFCADCCVHDLYTQKDVIAELVVVLGSEVLDKDGAVDRKVMGEMVFRDSQKRLRLEETVHPRVKEKCKAEFLQAKKDGVAWFVADIPLYFEGGGSFVDDAGLNASDFEVLVVACSEETQIQRLEARNGFDNERARSILESQLPLPEKILKADFVIWNEGSEQALDRQTELLFRSLEQVG